MATAMRTIGGSGIETPALVLGGNVFGWTIGREASFAVLDAFVAGGGRMIDTADMYSSWATGNRGGESEAIIGEWLRSRRRRGEVSIATKVGSHPIDGARGLGRAHVTRAVEASLTRLGIDAIDLYYVHRDDPDTPLEEVAATFDALVGAGKVHAIAASNFTADRLAAALDVQARGGFARYEALQPLYNLVERDGFEGPMQRLCVDHGLGVLPYYGLAAGYLTGKYRSPADLAGNPDRAGSVAGYVDGRGPAVLAAMDGVAAETGASLAQIALAWLAARPGVTAPIASATTTTQVEALLGATALRLTAEQVARLDAAGAPA